MNLYCSYTGLFYVLVGLFSGVMVTTFLMLSSEYYDYEGKKVSFRDKVLGKGEEFYLKLSTFLSVGMVVVIVLWVLVGSSITDARYNYINESIFRGNAISIEKQEPTEDLEKGFTLYKVLTKEGTYEILVKNQIKSDLTFDYEMLKETIK